MSKAFDIVKHVICVMQAANVWWNGKIWSLFNWSNGVHQGGVISVILYCFYMNDLFKLLRELSTGCWIKGNFHEIFVYSGNNFVLAPSLSGLQEMLLTCEEYAQSHNLKFSPDPRPDKCKTKCLAFLKKNRDLPSLKLHGINLPWGKKFKHLENTIKDKSDGMTLDAKQKKAKYISKNNELIQEFRFAHHDALLSINQICNTHFTGSQL